ncbi:hypothetical protein [Flavobacterium sp.]|uniref:hypothetical protein n=1 Tax=Flavobacterium sp. TaxID=239 RepID=UPI00286E6157|nr:hypothetical protein [Flavobacterium sp.]
MKYRFLLSITLAIFYSCGIQYDGETKLEIVGKLIDKNGNPVPNEIINIYVLGDDSIIYGGGGLYNELISFGVTNNKGEFQFLIPSPKVENNLSIEIGEKYNPTKTILFKNSNFINYKLNLNAISVFKETDLVEFRINLNNTNLNKTIQDIKIVGIQNETIVNLNPKNIESYYNQVLFYNVLKNQTVILKYKLIDFANNGVIQEFSENISILDNNEEFTITY